MNGFEKNWDRLRLIIRSFNKKYGQLPTKINMPQALISNICNDLFTPESLKLITEHINLIPLRYDESKIVAEDETGQTLDYDNIAELLPLDGEILPEWLGMRVDRPDPYEIDIAKENLIKHFNSQRYYPQEHYEKNVVNIDGKYLGPYIPYIGRYYFATKPRILIYAMAQNLNPSHSFLRANIIPWMKMDLLRLYKDNDRIEIGPYDSGYLKIISAFALNAYTPKHFSLKDDITDLVSVTNFVKFSFYSTGKSGNTVDANPPTSIYDVMWDNYCSYEIGVLKPDLIIACGHKVANALRRNLLKSNIPDNVIRVDFPCGRVYAGWIHKGNELINNGFDAAGIKKEMIQLIETHVNNLDAMKAIIRTNWSYLYGMKLRIEKGVKEIVARTAVK